jgi:acetyl-CoA acetyltransferase
MSNEAYIIGAVRSPTGRRRARSRACMRRIWSAHAIKALLERTGVDRRRSMT